MPHRDGRQAPRPVASPPARTSATSRTPRPRRQVSPPPTRCGRRRRSATCPCPRTAPPLRERARGARASVAGLYRQPAVAHADHALPAQKLHQLFAYELATPALQGPHLGFTVVPPNRTDDCGDVRLRRDE